jgi:hypothetical protein
MLLFSIRLPQTDTLVHRRKKIKRRRRKISQTWTCSAVDFFVWEFAVVAAAAPSLVFALTYCVYMYSTLVIFVVEWHSMTRHQRSSGLVWLDFPVSNPLPISADCWRSHAPQTSRRWWGQSSRLGDDDSLFLSSSPIESCGPATTETSRERDTEAIDIPIASSPLLYHTCLRSLYRRRRRTI